MCEAGSVFRLTILDNFSRLYPDAWKQVDEFRARAKELGGWPDWCFPRSQVEGRIGTRSGWAKGTRLMPGR